MILVAAAQEVNVVAVSPIGVAAKKKGELSSTFSLDHSVDCTIPPSSDHV
ncbi:MAG: hypothetical protein ACK5DG_12330 [Chitinophagaceae bacterium]